MKVLVLYRPNSEHGRVTEEFVHEYKSRHQDSHVEAINIDTREGSATAALYDVVQYPAIIALQSDGYLQKMWQGPEMPSFDEVAAYAQT